MPYIAVLNSLAQHFPDTCPYCASPHASSCFNQPYSKMSGSSIPGVARSHTWRVMLPACDRCARWFLRVRVAYFVFGFLGLFLGTVGQVVVPDPYRVIPQVLACSSLVIWATLWAMRVASLRHLRVIYIGAREVAYSTCNQRYGEMFAALNGIPLEKKRLLIRWD